MAPADRSIRELVEISTTGPVTRDQRTQAVQTVLESLRTVRGVTHVFIRIVHDPDAASGGLASARAVASVPGGVITARADAPAPSAAIGLMGRRLRDQARGGASRRRDLRRRGQDTGGSATMLLGPTG